MTHKEKAASPSTAQPMPAARPAFITALSNPRRVACCSKSIIMMKAENNTPRSRPLRMRPFHRARHMFTVGRDSPTALLENCLATIAELEPDIGAFVHRNEDAAREAAARSTQRRRDGKSLSPNDGMPLGRKDIDETSDIPT